MTTCITAFLFRWRIDEHSHQARSNYGSDESKGASCSAAWAAKRSITMSVIVLSSRGQKARPERARNSRKQSNDTSAMTKNFHVTPVRATCYENERLSFYLNACDLREAARSTVSKKSQTLMLHLCDGRTHSFRVCLSCHFLVE